jgi:predicted HAD superfamily Cof-like phosphohydrolase
MNPKEAVKEFEQAFAIDHPPRVAISLIEEEIKEAKEAGANFLKELCDIMYVVTYAGLKGYTIPQSMLSDLSKIECFVNGGLDANFQEAFDRVHQSNMSKLGEDGKPIRREDGKVLKGPNYKEPNLLDLIN